VDVINPSVSHALRDPLEEVREAASMAFEKLYKSFGSKAIDEVIPGASNTCLKLWRRVGIAR